MPKTPPKNSPSSRPEPKPSHAASDHVATKSPHATSDRATKSPHATSDHATALKQLKRDLLDDLFNDYYRERWRVYRINFFRGIFFGLGTFIGGTVVVALVVLFLGWLADTVPVFPEFTQWLLRTLGG